ncbi:MAG: hypothetical protein BGO82_01415 [Devosia sp. 67-54]|uniref:alpha/beta hydrolase n=1 Tax=unclassified Devosia TaxID=196773 RepID=UPI00095FBA08|nr:MULTISPECIES: hypothetical protein [unclassified Devosia]MBN9305877.1 phospholipase [Devosia sp.]OJX16427.1 MAG: hypothetical protein BGO82_01415 [Devosia sp. 67-54]
MTPIKLSGPMLPPKSGRAPKQLMVLLHGYGADGRDLIGLGGEWRDDYPDMLFVSPNAPWPCARNPGGFEWFALSDRPAEDFRREGADQARPVIVNFLIDLWAQTGLSARDTVLCGFSQGAMMALHAGLSLDQKVRGIIAFSGALIPPAGPWSAPPVALIHGNIDGVVPVQLSLEAETALRQAGVDARLFIEENTGHSIAPDGLGFATAFLHRILPPNA